MYLDNFYEDSKIIFTKDFYEDSNMKAISISLYLININFSTNRISSACDMCFPKEIF